MHEDSSPLWFLKLISTPLEPSLYKKLSWSNIKYRYFNVSPANKLNLKIKLNN